MHYLGKRYWTIRPTIEAENSGEKVAEPWEGVYVAGPSENTLRKERPDGTIGDEPHEVAYVGTELYDDRESALTEYLRRRANLCHVELQALRKRLQDALRLTATSDASRTTLEINMTMQSTDKLVDLLNQLAWKRD